MFPNSINHHPRIKYINARIFQVMKPADSVTDSHHIRYVIAR